MDLIIEVVGTTLLTISPIFVAATWDFIFGCKVQ